MRSSTIIRLSKKSGAQQAVLLGSFSGGILTLPLLAAPAYGAYLQNTIARSVWKVVYEHVAETAAAERA